MKYLILGAGPAGLTFANELLKKGESDFLLLEKESTAGGLCRSTTIDGSPLDIGGGHFLDAKNSRVTDFVFDFMPESQWDKYSRDSRIDMGSFTIGSPIEANIWQMPEKEQQIYLEAIASAGCNCGKPMPERFTDWIDWKLGKAIADNYMLPYNRKMFGRELDSLGTYWLEKLPNVSYEETLLSCKNHKPYGKQPGHAEFYYPKKAGYGQLFISMADALGEKIIYDTPAEMIDLDSKTVNGLYRADHIITTIPWKSFRNIKGLSDELLSGIASLKYTSVVIDYHPENMDTQAQWIYYPDPKLSYHRILVRHNFCPGSHGYWTETNLDRFDPKREMPSISSKKDNSSEKTYFINDYAYPLNTIGKPEFMDRLLKYAEAKGIYGLGRWGEWQHYNSDVVINRAIELADRMIKL